MTTVINKNIVNNLLDKIADLLGAEISHITCVNSRGEVTKKIQITYKEDE
mgnify:FL=1|tara:strand:- start:142 stop:291 length:150 start_codon:yes stop_codon:yes gene_type:complete